MVVLMVVTMMVAMMVAIMVVMTMVVVISERVDSIMNYMVMVGESWTCK
jgi:hypothetical protein